MRIIFLAITSQRSTARLINKISALERSHRHIAGPRLRCVTLLAIYPPVTSSSSPSSFPYFPFFHVTLQSLPFPSLLYPSHNATYAQPIKLLLSIFLNQPLIFSHGKHVFHAAAEKPPPQPHHGAHDSSATAVYIGTSTRAGIQA